MKTKYIFILILSFFLLSGNSLMAQVKKDISTMTKEEVLKMTYDELLNLPFEDLLKLAEIVGVSADELLEMILNMEVSTASKKAESVFDSPLSTTVITKDEIYASGVNSIPEALRLAPGLIVREKTNGNYDVHIRGNDNVPPGNFSHFAENSMTLVMIDNRIVYNYINGGTFWESLPIGLNDIERIDIIRGPSSALYGPNAVSGVINIITKNPEDKDFNAEVDLKHGNYNTLMAEAGFDGGIGNKFRYRVSGNYEVRDRYQTDYYAYALQDYVQKDDVVSVFGYPYATGGRGTLPTPELAMDRQGVNANLFYDVNSDFKLRFNTGYQESTAQTVFFENLATPFANRYSKTNYADFSADAYGLTAQVSYMWGDQDLSVGMNKPVIAYEMSTLNANIEYLYNLGGFLGIRPGINYQLATYDDSKYVADAKIGDPTREGLLNGEQSLSLFGGSLRADYTQIDNLRIIAALRLDKYEKPDDMYFSYQFVASYKLGDKHLLRGVYSRANRSAFIGNVYANFQNPLGPQLTSDTYPYEVAPGVVLQLPIMIDNYYQYYLGNENEKLLTQDMIEIGHRCKIMENLQTDIELFYTKTKDFDALVQVGAGGVRNYIDMTTTPLPTVHVNYHDSLQYTNLKVNSTQIGGSFSINYMPTKKMLIKAYGTYQKTDLTDYLASDNTIKDIEHKWTPSFYGGLSVNYKPVEKWTLYANLYYMSSQVYNRYESPFGENGEDKIGEKGILNVKVTYNFTETSSFFVSARNLTGNNINEFGFTDEIGSLYTVGLHFGL